MPVNRTILDDIFVGEYKELARTITDMPASLSLEKVWFTLKDNPTRTDAYALATLIKKSITTALTVDGQITDTGTNNIATFSIFLLSTDTAKLTARRVYLFDIWVKCTGLDPFVQESGVISPQPAITLDRT